MPLPRRALQPDETIVLDLHPHWKRLVLPVVALPLLAGATTYGLAAMPAGRLHRVGQGAVVAVALALLLYAVLLPYLRWRTTTLVLTDRRLVIRRGILARRGRDIPLSRVNDVAFVHGLLERLLGCGTLLVESAGERGQAVFRDVPNVEDVQRELYRLVEQDRRGGDEDRRGDDRQRDR